MIIIGIAGGTGSGKTTVVKKIIESLPEGSVAVIPQDSYYNDQSSLPLERRKQTNFDHPDAFDWALFEQQIAELRQGRSIEQPTYSYIVCTRLPETIHIEPKEVIIVEGIMSLYDKELRDLMDLKSRPNNMPTSLSPMEATIRRRLKFLSYISKRFWANETSPAPAPRLHLHDGMPPTTAKQ